MIIIWGSRFYGRIRACGSSFIATKFAHVWFVPLFPIGTHLVLEETGDSFRGIPADFSFKSMLAGYLRVWGPIGIVLALAITIGELGAVDDDPLALVVLGAFGAVVVIALLAAVVVAYAVMGKLSNEEKQHRSVYAIHTGYFVDPADMGQARHSLRQSLLETIGDRARGLAAMGYRLSADPMHAWPHIALDPTQTDEALITSAFTLSRIEGSLAQGPYKTQMDQVHMQLWQRILRANPPYLNAAAQAG